MYMERYGKRSLNSNVCAMCKKERIKKQRFCIQKTKKGKNI